jgi:hypothetical protein
MLRRIRIIRRAATLVASLAAVLTMASVPAVADDSPEVALRLHVPATFHLYNADEGAEALNTDFIVFVEVMANHGHWVRHLKVVLDTSGLGGVARTEERDQSGCTGRGSVFTWTFFNRGATSWGPFLLHGVDGVVPGDSGTLTYTATADNALPVTGTTRMTVDGPTLHSPTEQETVKGLAAGKSAALTPSFANLSRFTPERGIALRMSLLLPFRSTRVGIACVLPGGPAPWSAAGGVRGPRDDLTVWTLEQPPNVVLRQHIGGERQPIDPIGCPPSTAAGRRSAHTMPVVGVTALSWSAALS